MMEGVKFPIIHHSWPSKTYYTFYRQTFTCPRAAQYPLASVDPMQELHFKVWADNFPSFILKVLRP